MGNRHRVSRARKIEPIWIHGPVPKGFWTRGENRRAYFEWIEKKFKITRPEDWYEIRTRDLERFARGGIRAYFRTVLELVTHYIPWYDWKEWLFSTTPRDFWRDPHNQRRYLDWLGEKLGYEEPEDWYQVRKLNFSENRGETLLAIYGKDAFSKLMRFYRPDYDWKEWLFLVTPSSFWEVEENIYRYFDWLGEQLGYDRPEDWYRVKTADFVSNGGAKLLRKFASSPSLVVEFCLPDHEWFEWLFNTVPHGFWDDPNNLRRYFDWLAVQLGITEPEDWYHVCSLDFQNQRGSVVLKRFGGLCDAIKFYLPDHEWHEWFFEQTSRNFWARSENRHRYLDWLGAKLGYEKPEDWYQINRTLVVMNRGATILNYYGKFPLTVLQDYLPHHEWDDSRFTHAVPKIERGSKWDDPAERRRFLEELGEKLGFTKMEDWYRVTGPLLNDHGAQSILSRCRYSPARVVMEHFPEYDWKGWLFSSVPEGFWKNPDNVRVCFFWLGDKMGVEKPEDWYRIGSADYQRHGVARLLEYYSPISLVNYCLPEYEWLEWKFSFVPSGFWDHRKNVRRYLDWLGEQLGYEEPDDYYRLTTADFQENHGGAVIVKFGGICNTVRHCMPEREWYEWLFNRATHGFWTRPETRARYLDWLGEQLGYETPEDWYQLNLLLVRQHHGGKMVRYFRDFPADLMKEYMSDYDWKEWLFKLIPRRFWMERENCRRYLQWLGEKLGLNGPEEWDQLHRSDLKKNRGAGLLNRYGTIDKILRDVVDEMPPTSHPGSAARGATPC